MKSNELRVGLLLWLNTTNYPIIITYINKKQNCFRFIQLSDNQETENMPIISKGENSPILEKMIVTDKLKVAKYLSERKRGVQKQVNDSFAKLQQSLSLYEEDIKKMNEEFYLEDKIKETLAKFEETLPRN